MRVRTIGEAADLEINSKGTGFVRRSSVRAASPVAKEKSSGIGAIARPSRCARLDAPELKFWPLGTKFWFRIFGPLKINCPSYIIALGIK